MPENASIQPNPFSRPSGFEERFRLYLDESGDHVFREVMEAPHRFLCLLGCWFKNPVYLRFHEALEALKARFLPHHPDDPVVLHRNDMLNARKAFKAFRDPAVRAEWDTGLMNVIAAANFRAVAVVIDSWSCEMITANPRRIHTIWDWASCSSATPAI